jgi:hypothetical protein
VTAELLETFCALKGAVLMPRSEKIRHKAMTNVVLPASELVPTIAKGFIFKSVKVISGNMAMVWPSI